MDKEVAGATGVGMASTIAGMADIINPIVSALIGIASLVYICSKIYFLWKNEGKR